MASSNKDILFYSNFCEFSKNILILIQKKNCRDRFVLVCVDNPSVKNNLPREVDHVPLIITKTKHVMSGENIVKYIETFFSMKDEGNKMESQSMPTSDIMGNAGDPAAFSLINNTTFSETFTFIGDNQNHEPRLMGYGYIGGGGDQSVPTSIQSQVDTEKKGKIDEAYERYISERDADISRIFGNKRPMLS